MNVAEYARHRGCSERAVSKAIAANRISAERAGRVWSIDPALADREWVEHTDPAVGGRHDASAGEAVQTAPAAAPAAADGTEPGGIEALADSRKRWSHHRARLAETEAELAAIKLQLERGELVSAAAERQVGFRIARAFRDRMFNIPDRIAAELAAEGDAGVVHIILTREIREACLELAQLDFDAPPAAPE
ncbi:hypothetical protein AruPA_15210 [Acidiphilium sp. PA]|nr:hypothetical protein [Acidiphilium sp. PA]